MTALEERSDGFGEETTPALPFPPKKESELTDIFRNPPLIPLHRSLITGRAVPHYHKRRHGHVLFARARDVLARRQLRLDAAPAVGTHPAVREDDVEGSVGGWLGGRRVSRGCGAHAPCEELGVETDEADGVVAGGVVEVVAEGLAVADEGEAGGGEGGVYDVEECRGRGGGGRGD